MRLWRIFYVALSWLLLSPLVKRARAGKRAPSDAFVSVWMLLAVVTTLFGVLVAVRVAWSVPLFVVGLVLLMPWPVVRGVLIPLGMSRSARWLSRTAGWTWGEDCRGGGLVAGAWAILRQKNPDRARMAEIEALRDGVGLAHGGALEGAMHTGETASAAKVLATGLLAAARGDLVSARMLMASVDEIGPQTTAHAVHALAREWLVVDAAEHGRWADAARLAQGERARTRMTRLLGMVGRHLTLTRAPQDAAERAGTWSLWARWLLTNKRRSTYAIVKHAVAASASAATAPTPPGRRLATTLRPDFYQDALSAHVYTLARDATHLDMDDIARLANIWDCALSDPATRASVLHRAHALGANSGETALRALADEVSRDVANMARAADVAIAEHPGQSRVLADAQLWLRNDLIAEIELAFDAVQVRIMDRRELSSMDEWREFLSLRALYTRAMGLGGVALRRLAFPHVHHTVCKLAVWLWNERHETLIANAMFRWLLDEANAVGDAEAIELQSRNWDPKL